MSTQNNQQSIELASSSLPTDERNTSRTPLIPTHHIDLIDLCPDACSLNTVCICVHTHAQSHQNHEFMETMNFDIFTEFWYLP